MSSTRIAPMGRPLRQERFASSVEMTKGILANLVARRVECLPGAADRELIWWLQYQSLQRVGQPHHTCTSFLANAAGASVPGATAFEQLAHDLGERFPERVCGRPARLMRELPVLFTRLCLDPANAPERATASCFRDIVPALRAVNVERERAHLGKVAETLVTKAVHEALDFGLSQRGITLIEGTYRSGKSFSAQAWVLQRTGLARYASLPSHRDELSFFRTLATALGTAANAGRKAIEVRSRVEDALRSRDIMLVLDETESLLPSSPRAATAPELLRWVLSLDNAGCSVALIAGRNFSRMIAEYERRVKTFGWEQFWGRIRLRRQLPDSLSELDLFAIAERVAPDADEATRMLLIAHTLSAKGRVAALETTIKRARFLAAQQGRALSFDDVEATIAEASPRGNLLIHSATVVSKARCHDSR